TPEHRVPMTGFFRPPPPGGAPQSVRIMTTLGPMARDLGDLELALRVVAGPDGQDADVPPVPLAPRRRLPLERVRLAVAHTLPGITVARSIGQRVDDVGTAAASAGARVEASLPNVDWKSLATLFG